MIRALAGIVWPERETRKRDYVCKAPPYYAAIQCQQSLRPAGGRGVGEYLQASQQEWDIFIEEDFRARIENIREWLGDGVIADYDDPEIERLLADVEVPIVGVGGSYHRPECYPPVHYIATDNAALVESAFLHLKEKGVQRFAFYGLPTSSGKRWAVEREHAFCQLVAKEKYRGVVYQGLETAPENWQHAQNRLADWLQTLPRKPELSP
jgi:LacI family transcriptional regulator